MAASASANISTRDSVIVFMFASSFRRRGSVPLHGVFALLDQLANAPAENGRVAGVAQGLWHGLIAPVTAIGSFFNPDMQMYEVHNNGREYNLGSLIGVALVFLILRVTGGRGRRL